MGSLSYNVLSSGELDSFISSRLHFPDWKSVFEADKHKFLFETYRKFVTHIPFQNLTRVCRSVSEFKLPSKSEIIQDVLSGIGGGCTTLNYFFWVLLNTIGIDSYTIKGTFPASGHADTHLVTIARLGSVGGGENYEVYLCDVGSTGPMDEPILITPGCKYRRMDVDGIGYEYADMTTTTDTEGLEGQEEEETRVYAMSAVGGTHFGKRYTEFDQEVKFTHNLVPKEYNENCPHSSQSYTNLSNALLQIPCIFRYIHLDATRKHYVALMSRSFLEYDSDNKECPRKVTRFKTCLEAESGILEHFPMFSREIVGEALEYFAKAKCEWDISNYVGKEE